MGRSPVLDEIRRLDPAKDHQRIIFLSTCFDFPFDTTRSLELALFRTYASPSVSALLEQAGEFLVRAAKRYDDTDLIVSELIEWGYESERGRRALKRMNQIHARFSISNEDYLYVLSTFVYEPIRWNARFGWRRLCDVEKLAYFWNWREIGNRMGIRDIPDSFEAFERFNVEYERTHFRYAESNRKIAEATIGVFLGWFPRLLAPLVRAGMYALMDEPLLDAIGAPRPSRLVRALAELPLKARAWALPLLWPRRRKPRHRTAIAREWYPEGYVIEELGPPPFTPRSARATSTSP